MFDFLLFGAFGFYGLLVVICLIIVAFEETDHQVLAGLALIGMFIYLGWSGAFKIGDYVVHNPGATVLWVVGYFVIGAVSLWPKWYGFVSDKMEDLADRYTRYPNVHHSLMGEVAFDPPKPSQHKEKIISWAIFWPWSMFWFLLRHPLRRIGREIYNTMESSLNKISIAVTNRAKRQWEGKNHASLGDRQPGRPTRI